MRGLQKAHAMMDLLVSLDERLDALSLLDFHTGKKGEPGREVLSKVVSCRLVT